MKAAKFRPCLTSEQIAYIISLCKRDLTREAMSVICVLAPFQTKIENKSVSPSYITKEKKSIYSALGFEGNGSSDIPLVEQCKRAYEKWSKNPDSCNADDLDLVLSYRISNGLMSPEELQELNDRLCAEAEEIQRQIDAGNI
jgi:hypothetical protein